MLRCFPKKELRKTRVPFHRPDDPHNSVSIRCHLVDRIQKNLTYSELEVECGGELTCSATQTPVHATAAIATACRALPTASLTERTMFIASPIFFSTCSSLAVLSKPVLRRRSI